ncbi:carbohydrate kinase family protein [Breznakiella homolactica]|uniref:Carbohydrate kinase n=1 Tax=Breznakiella homolactica TaxID=2798577 RepID=A0A7T7XRC1_9SPIR|nr:carbohydrate kinase [Breznakiella homolactica]QQO11071.1 carbohydrate kinase [Breznakiella homolactica]
MILGCGEALIDMIPGISSGGEPAFLPCPGGSPYNTAIAAGRLGVPVSFLGRFSTDFFGETLIKRLAENHVGTGLITRSDQTSTLAFVKLEQGQEPRYIFYTEGSADRSFSAVDLPAVLPPEVTCIYFGSIAMTMEPVASTIENFILEQSRRTGSGAPVISLDPNIRPFMIRDREAFVRRFETWAAAATIAKISEADFEFIYPGLGLDKSMEKMLSLGVRIAVTTLGPEGAMALIRREDGSVSRVSAPVVDLEVIDTIGAGDTFHGSFLAWLEIQGKMNRPALAALSDGELRDALFFANKAASLVCSRRGAEPPTLTEIEALKV